MTPESEPSIAANADSAAEVSVDTPATSESHNNKSTSTAAESDEEKSPHVVTTTSSSKKKRPAYKYDPNKITLRFLFANRDGLAVTIDCDPSDTVGQVKALLISLWPKGKHWYSFGMMSFAFGIFDVGGRSCFVSSCRSTLV